jgi:hypothetical protein
MIELIVSAFGGAAVALAIAGYLARVFIKLQTDKALAHHSQALAIEKERLGHELGVQFHQKTIGISRYEKDRVEALKTLYAGIVNLGDALLKIRPLANLEKGLPFKAAYFKALQGIFGELSRTFNVIAETYRTLELQSVYLDDATEQQVKHMLDAVHNYYVQALARCDEVLVKARELGDALDQDTQPKELVALWSEMVTNWRTIVEPSKRLLKGSVRDALRA